MHTLPWNKSRFRIIMGGNGEETVFVDDVHAGCLILPIIAAALKNAQAVNPKVLHPEESADFYRVLKEWRE